MKTILKVYARRDNVKHISLLILKIKLVLILKISFLSLFGCGVKIHKINPLFGYRVKIIPDNNPIYQGGY